jgi:hypothetical protein
MKKIIQFLALLIFLSAPIYAQEIGFSLPLDKIRGVSLGYSLRPICLFGTSTGQTVFPTHFLYFNLDGFGSLENSHEQVNGVFGGIGVFLGLTAAQRLGTLNAGEDFYQDEYRLLSLDSRHGDLTMAGCDIRIIDLLSSSSNSIWSTYFQFSFEGGYLGLNYLGESGAFNRYVDAVKNVSGAYFGITPGYKFYIFDVYGNIGCVTDFYKRQPGYTPADNSDDIANAKSSTWHFLASVGVGVSFDFCSLTQN